MKLLKYLPRFRQAQRELRRLEERERWTRSEIEAFQLERVNALWNHARRHTTYYRQLIAERSLPHRFRSLEEFVTSVPVVSKDDLRNDLNGFRSETRPRGEW